MFGKHIGSYQSSFTFFHTRLFAAPHEKQVAYNTRLDVYEFFDTTLISDRRGGRVVEGALVLAAKAAIRQVLKQCMFDPEKETA